jgi:hypothetical protein
MKSVEQNRIILAHGDKGGVGKSTFARLLADYYEEHNIIWHGYDTDNTNGHLVRFFGAKTTPILLRDEASTSELLNALEAGSTHNLIDMGARSGEVLSKWMADTDFLALCTELGFRVTVAFVLSPVLDSVALLKTVAEQIGEKADYVVIKNEALGSSFEVYDKSKTRVKVTQELGGIEIVLPELAEHAYQRVDQLSISWRSAVETKELALNVRQYVKVWLRRGFEQIEKAHTKLV